MMRFTKVLMLLALLMLPLLTACGGGGGGDSAGGVAIDNSRAVGTYTYVYMMAGSINVQIGTATFDGSGGGNYTEDSPSGAGGTFTYTVNVDNTITLDNGIVGTMRNGGSFFVGTDTRNSSEAMMLGIKQSNSVTDSQNTYLGGQFIDDGSGSMTMIAQVDTATPSAGTLAFLEIQPCGGVGCASGNETYSLNTSTGEMSIPNSSPYQYGAVSSDQQLIIVGDDGSNVSSPGALAFCGLKVPSGGMSASNLSGTYMVYQFMDDNISGGGSYVSTRSRVTLDGISSGSYQDLASSSGTLDSGSFNYTVSSTGQLGGDLEGTTISDGSVFGIVDYDNADNAVSLMIGVKQ